MKKTLFILTAMVIVLFSACTEKNKPNSGGGETATEEGALNGIFSVSATKKVCFSQGNLQYQASTGLWRFAEHQYDYVGDAINGNVYIGDTKCNNASISSSYAGWIDLFGWGTGYYPTKTIADVNIDFSVFTDWGVNAISNGGNIANIWRTLSYEEWTYLLRWRINAGAKYGVASVNGYNGLVVLPDNWTLPSGCSFNPDVNPIWTSNDFAAVNTYTLSQWALMEKAGAIFLPAAGQRAEQFYCIGTEGYYWSSSELIFEGHYFDDKAWDMTFAADSVYIYGYGNRRYCGQSVRLVQDVK